jgi:hypothetical protein
MRCLEAKTNKNDCEQRWIEQRVIAAKARYAGGRQKGEHRRASLQYGLFGETGPGHAG